MPTIVSIKFNDAETEVMQRAHAASGTAGVSSHIKQVYFDALKLNVGVLQEVNSELERLANGIDRLHQDEGRGTEPQLLLSMVCGLYVMVRKSVGESIRSQADQTIDVSAIEAFLKGR
ncbi:MAG: hypothetical protein EOO28_34975 [Comamonadaceae bacterium]|nr:MAG: hypothetical protein EOO28_34975 [Comamonadaceae bacterium]